ncbi:MAG TPA: TIGR03936 family radical SAM-associated protein, partial [Nitrospirota bacterium]
AARAGVPVVFSQGFNPHPRISFGPALSVGMESETEYLDMETESGIDLLHTTKALNNSLPEGVKIREAKVVPRKAPSLSGSIRRYAYAVELPEAHAGGIDSHIKDFLFRPSVIVSKEGKQQNIRQGIESIAATQRTGLLVLSITLVDQEGLKPRVQDVLEQLFGVGREQSALFRIKRTGMYCREKDRWSSPMDA